MREEAGGCFLAKLPCVDSFLPSRQEWQYSVLNLMLGTWAITT
jgi:hypothetical protein